MNVPIIYIHTGYAEYFKYALLITKHYNPTARIILLGDRESQRIANEVGVEFHNIQPYDQAIPYHHLSVNGVGYESFCFKRWFIIKNFLTRHGIEKFIHSDSDNVVCYTLTDDMDFAPNSGLGFNTVVVPNLIYLYTDTLCKITDFYMELYSLDFQSFKNRVAGYTSIVNNSPQYSDMMFLAQCFRDMNIPFMYKPELDSRLLFHADFFKFPIEYRGGAFYRKGRDERLFNIHFSGINKRYIKEYYMLL